MFESEAYRAVLVPEYFKQEVPPKILIFTGKTHVQGQTNDHIFSSLVQQRDIS